MELIDLIDGIGPTSISSTDGASDVQFDDLAGENYILAWFCFEKTYASAPSLLSENVVKDVRVVSIVDQFMCEGDMPPQLREGMYLIGRTAKVLAKDKKIRVRIGSPLRKCTLIDGQSSKSG